MAGSPPESAPGYVTGTSSSTDRFDRPVRPTRVGGIAAAQRNHSRWNARPGRNSRAGRYRSFPARDIRAQSRQCQGQGPSRPGRRCDRPRCCQRVRSPAGQPYPPRAGLRTRREPPDNREAITDGLGTRVAPHGRRRPCGAGPAPGAGHRPRPPGSKTTGKRESMAISCPVPPPTGGDGQETPLPINNRESPVPRQLFRRIPLPIAVNQHPLQPPLQRGPVWTNPREAPAPAMSPIGAPVVGPRVTPA